MFTKNYVHFVVERMVQQLRALAAPGEDLLSVSIIQMEAHNHSQNMQEQVAEGPEWLEE